MDMKKAVAFICFGAIVCLIIISSFKGEGDSNSEEENKNSKSELVDINNEDNEFIVSVIDSEVVDVNLNKSETNETKEEDYITYELLNGKKVELSKNPKRVQYISDKEMKSYLETAITYIYSISNFDKYDEKTMFESSLKYLDSDLRNSVEGLIGRTTEELNLKYQGEHHSHNIFPYEKYSNENKDVDSRTITKIDVSESEIFAYPFLQLHFNVKSTIKFENGSTDNRENLFVIEFAFGKSNKITFLYMDETPPTSAETETE